METQRLTAEQTYDLAYAAHYSDGDKLEALRNYALLFTNHPNSQQARDARLQIRAITAALATIPEIVAADLSLAISHITEDVPLWFREMIRPTPGPSGTEGAE